MNDEAIDGKKSLKSGDVISLLENKLRWESKAESRRNLIQLKVLNETNAKRLI